MMGTCHPRIGETEIEEKVGPSPARATELSLRPALATK